MMNNITIPALRFCFQISWHKKDVPRGAKDGLSMLTIEECVPWTRP